MHSFFFRELQLISDFKLEDEVLKFIYVFVSWSFPETDLETNFLGSENRSFEKVRFDQQKVWHFSKCLTFLYLLTYLLLPLILEASIKETPV